MGNKEEEIEIDLAEVLAFLLHWLWLIILSGLICGSIGLAVSAFVISPKYQSTTKVYILNKQNNNGNISYSDTQLATQLTKDYEELITCRNVLEKVIVNLKLNDSYDSLLGRVSVANASDTRIISITVKDINPEEARRIANEVRDVASAHITEVMDIEAVNVVDEANLPDIDKPAEPSITKFTAVGALIGVFICVAFLLIKYLADDTIRVSEDVEKYLELSTLGLIPIMEGEEEKTKKKTKRKSGRRSESEKAKDEISEVPGDKREEAKPSYSSAKDYNTSSRQGRSRNKKSNVKRPSITVADIDKLDEEITVRESEESSLARQMEKAEMIQSGGESDFGTLQEQESEINAKN
jgi:capsular polysaccharide biosynthesis protein